MQYVLAKMLFATERLLKTLPCPTCSLLESHTGSDAEGHADTDGDREVPSLLCELDSVSESNSTPQGTLLKDLKTMPADNSRENNSHQSPYKACSVESHTSAECNTKRLKQLLLDRWLLLLKLFGMKPSEEPVEVEVEIMGEGEGEKKGEKEHEGEEEGEKVVVGDKDGVSVQHTFAWEEEHCRIDKNGPPIHPYHESSSISISVPLPVSPGLSASISARDPVPVSPSVITTSVRVSSSASAHAAAVGMVHTAFKDRGPLTADEGAALRLFFSEIGSR
jgi:hypothetical protein